MDGFVTLREVMDFKRFTITLLGPDDRVLRHHEYTKETFPVIRLGSDVMDADVITERFEVPVQSPELLP